VNSAGSTFKRSVSKRDATPHITYLHRAGLIITVTQCIYNTRKIVNFKNLVGFETPTATRVGVT
jgi:hypothetical protein